MRRDAWLAIGSLQRGDRTFAMMLACPQAADQYRALVHLVLTAAYREIPAELHYRTLLDLMRYSVFVRCSLRHLVEAGEALEPGSPPLPVISRPVAAPAWRPEHVPPEWADEIVRTHPEDPLYGPAQ
jgi:hypothetical protein